MVRAPVPAATSTAADPFLVIEAPGGVELHLLQTDRFKTVVLQWVVEHALDEERAARALLPDLLTRGTRCSPGLAEMAARQEELYAADLQAAVTAQGTTQLLRMGVSVVSDRFAEGRGLFSEAVSLFAEVLHDPPLVDGRFRPDHLAQERENLVRAIDGLTDDKALYAYRRMVETMHEGTPRALHSWGDLASARALDEPSVRRAWADVTAVAPVRMFVVGDITPAAATEAATRLGRVSTRSRPSKPMPPAPWIERPVRERREQQPLAQSKLVMGFRVRPELLPGSAAPLFGMVFGGDSHSRLFKRVREAEGLAYGCSAHVAVDHGMLVVQAGIDAGAASRVQQIVLEELERLAAKPPPPEELELSRRALQRHLADLADAPRAHCAFRLGALLAGRPHVVEDAVAGVREVRPEDISAVAAGCRLDTVFLLEGSPS
ncbi:MAG: M16 family metallopeptidase [Planctomycetota bacterium]|jgi:predicted Zn-dependent peptidase